MKISLNTIRKLVRSYGCADDVTAIGVDKLVEKIGAQLGAVEEVIHLGKKYDNIAVVKVVSCQPHPNADKLKVCLIDDGRFYAGVERNEQYLIQVVCGAPNVRAGMLAVWIPPGTTVPETADKEPFVLEAREIRGVVSSGMLASPKELALGDGHDGILEIDQEVRPGVPFDEEYNLENDVVLDIENKMFTHRPDCFGWLGVARELAGIQDMPFKSPDWYVPNPQFPDVEAEELKLEVHNELPDLAPRFTAITMREVRVGPSPVWLQVELAKIGQKSINNIVDYTNYFMLLTGQPLHAYDYDKVAALSGNDGATLVIRNPKSGEKIKLLNGKEIEPRAEAIMIATDRQLIGIGGVMGGTETEVDENTTNIILECANFDMYSIRRTSMAHGLFTDAVTRFTKGQSPLQNLAVLAKITEEIRAHADGKVVGQVIDNNHLEQAVKDRNSLHPSITITQAFINQRLGLQLGEDEVRRLLQNVEFNMPGRSDNSQDITLEVVAPFWRTDIELREDIVEEVGRLYGFDKLPLELPKRDLTPVRKDPLLELKAKIRAELSKAGANEVLTYSFVHGNLLEKVGQDKNQAFQISNALSPDLQYYRLSLTPSLLEKIHPNVKAGYGQFALFEIGKAHVLGKEKDGLPIEFERLALTVVADKKTASRSYQGAPYYQVRKYLMTLLEELKLAESVVFEPLEQKDSDSATSYYAPGRSATLRVNDQIIGRVGEYKTAIHQALKLPDFSAGFELGLTSLLQLQEQDMTSYVPLPRFPKVSQDITLKIPAELNYQELFDFVWAKLGEVQPDNTLPNLNPVDIYQSADDPQHKHVTLRLTIASYDRTLTDTEVSKLLDTIAAAAIEKYAAERA
ncbi:MAG: phenylalanine--tRNA ligase subunit beta [Candidatus Saccharimonadales bacterium]